MRQSLLRWGLPIGVTLALLAAMTLPQLAEAAGGSATPSPALPRSTYLSPLSPVQIAALSANQSQKVIVLLKNQYANVPGAGGQLSQREAALATDQAPITGELHALHAPDVHAYQFVNAVAATTSAAEVARLSADPDVQAVVPDVAVQGPTVTESAASMAEATGGTVAAAATPAPAIPPVVSGTAAGICPTSPSQPLLEPEALQLMNVNFGPGSAQLSASQLATGAGVKIAVFPDGLDPNIPDFIRDGQSAIFDYQDFTGEGVNGVTGAEEAFGDVSSLVAQGNESYDLSGEVNPAHPLPAGCTIRIEGVAPGASVAVMKVFGNSNATFNSVLLQGIDYAVTHDHVDILSESVGENPIPNPGDDPIAIADADAVAAGITVVASTGDAGLTNTISTPADAPGVISAGASTSYREYAQTGSYGYSFGGNGWESDNVSSPSSSGETDAGPNTIDVLAPGENGWADCSTDTAVFTECADTFNGPDPQPIVAFGGTSEAAPLTAGVAALVIQAYRSAHGGASPAPALVKQIIMSSAQDLGVPASEEGAGLVDGLRAVQDAMSVAAPTATPTATATATATGLLYSPNSISLTGEAGQSSVRPVAVTNVGTTTQTVTPSVRALAPASSIAQGTLNLNAATDPTMVFQSGVVIGDVHLLHFTVPPGTQRLLSKIAWQTATQVTATVRESLFDPSGDMAAQSRPQGDGGGFGQVEVRDPAPGTWTMLTFDAGVQLSSAPSSVLAPYTGPLAYTITSQTYRTVQGSVLPPSQVIGPGASATFYVRADAPPAPGDLSESLVFGSNLGAPGDPSFGSVPIVTRALVPIGPHGGGSFSGTLTGGNERQAIFGQDLIYQFDVGHAVHNQVLSVNVTIADPGYQVLGVLTDPDFSPVDAQSTISSVSTQNFQTLTLTWLDPVPGRWTLDLAQIENVSSGVTGARIRGTIRLGPPQAVARGLPDGQRLPVSSTVNAGVVVTNKGTEPEAYSIDPRLTTTGVIPLASLVTPTDVALPVTNTATVPQFVVPPFTTGLEILAESTVPIALDTSPAFGIPDVEAVSSGDTALATLSAPDIPASLWSCGPSPIGPFSAPMPATTFECGAAALTDSFDPGVDSDTGNIWSALEGETANYAPLVLAPGQTGTIGVTLTVTGTPRQRVNGFLAVETFNPTTFSSDQVAALPYSYRVGS